MAGSRAKSGPVKQEAIQDTTTFLQSLPAKPKEELSLKEAVGQIRESIQAALSKGYSYEDLAPMLSEKGIRISAATLKNYVPSGKRQVTKTKTRKAKKAQENGAIAEQPEVQLEVQPEAAAPKVALPQSEVQPEPAVVADSPEVSPAEATPEPIPVKPRRGRARTASAAKAKTDSQTKAKQPGARRSSTANSTAKSTSTRRRKQAEA